MLIFLNEIFKKPKADKLPFSCLVPLLEAWRLYNFPKVALGSLVVSCHLFERLKKIYSDKTRKPFKISVSYISSKIDHWKGPLIDILFFFLMLIFFPFVIYLISKNGNEFL